LKAFFDYKHGHLTIYKSNLHAWFAQLFNNSLKDVRLFFETAINFHFRFSTELYTAPTLEKAKWCLNWVKQNIHYTSESVDYWQSANETLTFKTGDCEDGAILLANMLLAVGISPMDVYLCVITNHAFMLYREGKIMLKLDWTTGQIEPWNHAPYWLVWSQKNIWVGTLC
jgi:hypothetical protein